MTRKTIHAEYEDFFESPTKERLAVLVAEGHGETDNLDFKKVWPEKSALARHLLALANSGGGVLVIGVNETKEALEPVGLKEHRDKSDIAKQVEKYSTPALPFEVANFDYGGDASKSTWTRKFQVAFVHDRPKQVPFVCRSDGDSCTKADIYVRRGTESTKVNYNELQQLLSRRIETQFTATRSLMLDEHLDQLERLFSRIPRFIGIEEIADRVAYMGRNPDYPEEGFEEFVALLIEQKKRMISDLISRN